MIREFGFSEKSRINITALPINRCSPNLIVSPSGDLLAFISEQCQPSLFNTTTHQALNQTISNPLQSLIFAPNDLFLYYTTPFAIIEYDISRGKERAIVELPRPVQNGRGLASLRYSDDFRTLYYVNNSDLYSLRMTNESALPQRLI